MTDDPQPICDYCGGAHVDAECPGLTKSRRDTEFLTDLYARQLRESGGEAGRE